MFQEISHQLRLKWNGYFWQHGIFRDSLVAVLFGGLGHHLHVYAERYQVLRQGGLRNGHLPIRDNAGADDRWAAAARSSQSETITRFKFSTVIICKKLK